MQKRIYLLMVILGLVFLFTPKVQAVSDLDQQYLSGSQTFVVSQTPGVSCYQSFTPAKNVLNKVGVEIYDNFSPTGKMGFSVTKWNGSGWTLIKTSKLRAWVVGWNYFEFGDTAVTVGDKYAITIAFQTDNMPRWKYSSNGSYSGGNAFINGTDQPAADANFRTFGYQTDNPPSPGGTTEEEDLSASANPSSNASLSPSPGGAASVIENIIRNNKTFLDFGENLWRNYWAIVSLGAAFLAVIGLIIWYLVVRRNKTQFGDSKRGRRPPSEEKSARSYGENDDSNNKQG